MNKQDQIRKEFEMWARERGYQRDELARCSIGIVGPEYFNLNTEGAWQAWQAARVSLEAAQKDAARYRYLTQQHGDYCITDAMENTSGVFKSGAADSVIDAAMASKS